MSTQILNEIIVKLKAFPWELYWQYGAALLSLFYLIIIIVAAYHIIMTKEPVQSAVGWLGLVVLSPFIGGFLYLGFGINRIKRAASASRAPRSRPKKIPKSLKEMIPHESDRMVKQLFTLGQNIHPGPIDGGNRIRPLVNGDEAYPAMINAIEHAQKSVALCSYIFDYDDTGRLFTKALAEAHKRGVTTRVLIDDVGARYSPKPIDRILRRSGVKTARFMPRWSAQLFRFANLRTHRKILLVDGQCAFIGGMNIRHGACLEKKPDHPIQDIHFKLEGPAISGLNEIFQEDWLFSTNENISLPNWPEKRNLADGRAFVRAIPDGPDVDLSKLWWLYLGALSVAQKSIRIVTPYFLPDPQLSAALKVEAMKGLNVEVVLPEKNNLFFMDWAMEAHFEDLLQAGVKIYRSSPPFDHSKIFTVDDRWAFVGSSNLDSRSLRLNFEANIAVVDDQFNLQLKSIIDQKKARSRLMTVNEVKSWHRARKFRNRMTNLLSPYL